ncbi:type II secretion system major pseudopilin GspG [Pseudomonas sp. GD03858]|uniref:type II secretion system major pseudopilin GspG n=1 Tax=unclassified Pseudomonas TaxID=196821 RepID=UPI002446E222|nr:MULTISPECIES: type II secretion system major pseudopilin GspG [unclassified Pseudomonas]MDH0648601.1 type II secretion system major pseudopilin GspG [Pseudomonas sp. GD03867]MDH0664608.1 type II secretion system major pseudopilin GspG [Pseudomonas sp. GD03858]
MLSSRRNRGFTLLEMLAVIVLLGIVATIVVRQVGGNVDKGKVGAGKAQLASLGMKIENYAMDVGSPPQRLEDLLSKPVDTPAWQGPYAKQSDLRDPFGHGFGYQSPGEHGSFDLVFFGRDGKPGGEGADADLGSWQ